MLENYFQKDIIYKWKDTNSFVLKNPVEMVNNMPSDTSYELIRHFVKFSARLGYRMEVEGTEKLMDHHDSLKDGAIFAANHESVIDAFLMGLIVPMTLSRIYFLGKKSALWRNRFWGSMMDYFGVIPVAKKGNEEAIRKGLEVLRKSQALGIFPEGSIRYKRKSLEGKVGVARFAFETTSPVVPVGIIGTDGVLPYGGNWPSAGKKVTLTIGEPIYLSYEYDSSDMFNYESLRQATNLIMYNIRLLSEGYGINPLDAPKLECMTGIDRVLIPHRRKKFLEESNLINVRKKGVVDHFSEWIDSLSDEWTYNTEEEVKREEVPSEGPSKEFLGWLDDQL
jgi:1-acyl-sn-glycerol-3-phosphate acyltransferase